NQGFFGRGSFPIQSVGKDRWRDSLATIAEGHVILTPAESNEIHCLNLLNGERVWKSPREDGLYVGGVHDGKVLVVGRRQVIARDVATGKMLWTRATPGTNAEPSGRGFLSDGHYYLPLTTREVVRIDASNGRITAISAPRDKKTTAPGNLICYRGTVISQSHDYIQRFDELTQLEETIEADLARNPKNADALSRRGQIRLQQGKTEFAVRDFRESLEINPDDDQTRESLIESLLERLRVDFVGYRKDVPEIEGLLEDSPAVRRDELHGRFLRVLAMGLDRAEERAAAFATWMKFVGNPGDGPKLDRVEGSWSVRRDRLVQGRIRSLYQGANPDEKKIMDAEILGRFDLARSKEDADALRRFIRYFGGHPVADDAREALALNLMENKNILEAESLLLRLSRSRDSKLAHRSVARLAGLLADAGRPDDSAIFYRRLSGELADQVCLGGMTGKQLADALAEDSPVRRRLESDAAWTEGKVEAKHVSGGSSNVRRYPVESLGDVGPFFQDGDVVVDQSQMSILGRDRNGKIQWTAKLNAASAQYRGLNPYANRFRASGHVLFMWTGQAVYAVDTLSAKPGQQARILWQKNLNNQISGVAAAQGVRFRFVGGAGAARRVIATDIYGQELSPIGPAGPDFVCFQRRRELVAVDPLSGEELWVRHDITPGSGLFGDGELVFVLPPNATEAVVLRGSDGQRLGSRPLPPIAERVADFGRRWLVWSVEGGRKVLKMRDLWEKKDIWKHPFALNARASADNREVAVMEPSGKVNFIDLKSGKVVVDEKVDAIANLTTLHVMRTGERRLLVASGPWVQKDGVLSVASVSGGLDNPVISGHVHGFDAKGKKVWSTAVAQQSLPRRQPANLPVLVFACRMQIRKGGRFTNEYEIL
ncbi:MAG: PQQ-binding-like beta-propeller repeat protein, partial [Planctomycetales bacterium]